MTDEDDVLADYDLSAWEAPPPSAGLADAVIARAKQPVPAVAVDPEPRPTSKRWWIAGGTAAALVAAAALVVWGVQRAPQNGSDDVVATTARALDLGPSSARLDSGTEVHWRRDKHQVTVAQPRGAATWTIGGDDTFVIDAGATVASVEASGASLRVEVKMNTSDARVMGASAVTAAVVAMVTVIVYEGRVKVTHGGQTVNVEPGATVELRGTVPPPSPEPVADKAAELREQIAVKDREIRELRQQIEEVRAAGGSPSVAPAKTTCDFDGLVQKGDELYAAGTYAAALVTWEEAYACKPDKMMARKLVMASCSSRNIPKAKLYWTKVDESIKPALTQICVRNNIDITAADPPACDADALRQKGEDHLQTGMDAAALAAFEASMKCRPDATLMRFAFMAACRSKNAAKARFYYDKVPEATSSGIRMICVRNGIELPSRTDDTDAALPAGMGAVRFSSNPPARIMIDGKNTGKTTPATLTLAAGRHKVTYVLGDDKFTWALTVEAGKTVTMVKDLQ